MRLGAKDYQPVQLNLFLLGKDSIFVGKSVLGKCVYDQSLNPFTPLQAIAPQTSKIKLACFSEEILRNLNPAPLGHLATIQPTPPWFR